MCVFSYDRMTFSSCDIDLDPMTLKYELDLNIYNMYLNTKNEVSRARLSKVGARTGHHARTRKHATVHTRRW